MDDIAKILEAHKSSYESDKVRNYLAKQDVISGIDNSSVPAAVKNDAYLILRHIARKHGLPHQCLQALLENLNLSTPSPIGIKEIIISQAIRYGIENGKQHIPKETFEKLVESIFTILENSLNLSVTNELAFALGCIIDNIQDRRILVKIEKKIPLLDKISYESKSFLLRKSASFWEFGEDETDSFDHFGQIGFIQHTVKTNYNLTKVQQTIRNKTEFVSSRTTSSNQNTLGNNRVNYQLDQVYTTENPQVAPDETDLPIWRRIVPYLTLSGFECFGILYERAKQDPTNPNVIKPKDIEYLENMLEAVNSHLNGSLSIKRLLYTPIDMVTMPLSLSAFRKFSLVKLVELLFMLSEHNALSSEIVRIVNNFLKHCMPPGRYSTSNDTPTILNHCISIVYNVTTKKKDFPLSATDIDSLKTYSESKTMKDKSLCDARQFLLSVIKSYQNYFSEKKSITKENILDSINGLTEFELDDRNNVHQLMSPYIHSIFMAIKSDRSQEIFDSTILSKMISLVAESNYISVKEKVCQLLSFLVSHNAHSNTFSEEHLVELAEAFEKETSKSDSDGNNIPAEILFCVQLILERTNCISKSSEMVEKPLKIFIRHFEEELGNETVTNLLLMVMAKMSDIVSVKLTNANHLDEYILHEEVIVINESKDGVQNGYLAFEKPLSHNKGCVPLSMLGVKLLLHSIKNFANFLLSKASLTSLLECLDLDVDIYSPTRLVAAETLYIYVCEHKKKFEILEDNIFHGMTKHFDDPIPLIKFYSRAVFAKLCSSQPIDLYSFETMGEISSALVWHRVDLGEKIISQEINLYVLNFFENAASNINAQIRFEKCTFEIINRFLVSECKESDKALSILQNYVSQNKTLPLETMNILESFISTSDIDDGFGNKIFQRCVENGAEVSKQFLAVLKDCFYDSEDATKRLRAYKLMEIANKNQILDDGLFNILEMESCGYTIIREMKLTIRVRKSALNFFKRCVELGQKVSLTNMEMLANICHDEFLWQDFVIPTLSLILNNNQTLPEQILDTLGSSLKQDELNYQHFSKFLLSVSQKGQILPHFLNDVIEDFIYREATDVTKKDAITDAIFTVTLQCNMQQTCISNKLFSALADLLTYNDCSSVGQDVLSKIIKAAIPLIIAFIRHIKPNQKCKTLATEIFLKCKEIEGDLADVNIIRNFCNEGLTSVGYEYQSFDGGNNANDTDIPLIDSEIVTNRYTVNGLKKMENEIDDGIFPTDSDLDCLLKSCATFDEANYDIYVNIFFKLLDLEVYTCKTFFAGVASFFETVLQCTVCETETKLKILEGYSLMLADQIHSLNSDKVVGYILLSLPAINSETLWLGYLKLVATVAEFRDELHDSGVKFLETNLSSPNKIARNFAFRGLVSLYKNQSKFRSPSCEIWVHELLSKCSASEDKNQQQFTMNDFYIKILEIFVNFSELKTVDLKKIHQNEYFNELIFKEFKNQWQASGQCNSLRGENLLTTLQTKFGSISPKLLSEILISKNPYLIKFEIIMDALESALNLNSEEAENEVNPKNFILDKFHSSLIEKYIFKLLPSTFNDSSYKKAKIASQMANILGVEKSFAILSRTSKIDNVQNFYELIACAKNYDLAMLSSLSVDKVCETQLLHICFAEHFSMEQKIDKSLINSVLQGNIEITELRILLEICHKSDNDKKIAYLSSFLKLLVQFKIEKHTFSKIFDAVKSLSIDKWLPVANKTVLNDVFGDNCRQKILDELMNSVVQFELPDSKKKWFSTLREDILQIIHNVRKGKIVSAISKKVRNVTTHGTNYVASWEEKTISKWANEVRNAEASTSISDEEFVAVTMRANYLVTEQMLTDPQIIGILISLKFGAENERGILQQIVTGGGKSTIIRILAVIHVLKKHKVDIFTSNAVLAERDAKQSAKFFSFFEITASDNCDRFEYTEGPKMCYEKDIVFGEASQFQFDILRDEYSSLGTLSDRKFDVAIVDEVDSMLIDDSSKIAKLSSGIPGLDLLQPVYHIVWHQLNTVMKNIISLKGRSFHIRGQIVKNDDSTVTIRYLDELGFSQEIMNFESFVENGFKPNHCITELFAEPVKFISEHLKSYLESILSLGRKDSHPVSIWDNILDVPANFVQFVKMQIPRWVESAITAHNFQENIHYIVCEGQIKPVDYCSTGIILESTNWSDGLHQFLQIKHGLKMTCETLTTNFMSNYKLFRRYKNNLYGFTGTFGSKTSKKNLFTIYDVNLVIIPDLYEKRYKEYDLVTCPTQEVWVERILDSTLFEISKNRGVLIICETIKHALMISKFLKRKMAPWSITMFTMNNMNQECQIERIKPGEVIVATNLAGRGTDIKCDMVEEYGGLHVCLTFMPENQRVEDQAFGRTARQGNCGTGQMILNTGNRDNSDLINWKDNRDLVETNTAKMFVNKLLSEMKAKDRVFEKFCNFLNTIRNEIRESKENKFLSRFNNVVGHKLGFPSKILESAIMSSIEEQWALALFESQRNLEINQEETETSYSTMYTRLESKLEDQKTYGYKNLITNPYIAIKLGNFLLDTWGFNDQLKEAESYFKLAILLDNKFSAAAYLGLALLELKIKGDNYKLICVDHLKNCLGALEKEKMSLMTIILLLTRCISASPNKSLLKQTQNKEIILTTIVASINNALKEIQRSLRLVDIVAKDSKTTTCFEQQVRYKAGSERKEMKVYAVIENSYSTCKFELLFHNLSVMKDMNDVDQAIKLLEYTENISGVQLSTIVSECEIQNLLQFNIEKEFETNKDLQLFLQNPGKIQNEFKNSLFQPSNIIDVIIHKNDGRKLIFNVNTAQMIHIANSFEIDDKKLIVSFKNESKHLQILESSTLSVIVDDVANISLWHSNLHIKKHFDNDLLVTLTLYGPIEELVKICHSKLVDRLDVCELGNEKIVITTDVGVGEAGQLLTNMDKAGVRFAIPFSEVCNISPQLKCDIKFSPITTKLAKDLIDSILDLKLKPSLLISDLTNSTSTILVNSFRGCETVNFKLGFGNLKRKDMINMVSNNSIVEEDFDVELRSLREENSHVTQEVDEFISKGFNSIISLRERNFLPYRNMVNVAILGGLQVAVGGALMATQIGAPIGSAIMWEGTSDFFTLFRAYRNRKLDWKTYGTEKAISLALSTLTFNVTSMNGFGTEAVEHIGTRGIANKSSIQMYVTNAMSSIASMYSKNKDLNVSHRLQKVVIAINDYENFSMETYFPQIYEHSKCTLLKQVDPFLKSLNKIYVLAIKPKFNDLLEDLKAKLLLAICDKNQRLNSCLWSMSNELCGLICTKQGKENSTSKMISISSLLSGNSNVETFWKIVIKLWEKTLARYIDHKLSIPNVLYKQFQIPKTLGNEIAKETSAQNVFRVKNDFKFSNDFIVSCKMDRDTMDEIMGFFRHCAQNLDCCKDLDQQCQWDDLTTSAAKKAAGLMVEFTDKLLTSYTNANLFEMK